MSFTNLIFINPKTKKVHKFSFFNGNYSLMLNLSIFASVISRPRLDGISEELTIDILKICLLNKSDISSLTEGELSEDAEDSFVLRRDAKGNIMIELFDGPEALSALTGLQPALVSFSGDYATGGQSVLFPSRFCDRSDLNCLIDIVLTELRLNGEDAAREAVNIINEDKGTEAKLFKNLSAEKIETSYHQINVKTIEGKAIQIMLEAIERRFFYSNGEKIANDLRLNRHLFSSVALLNEDKHDFLASIGNGYFSGDTILIMSSGRDEHTLQALAETWNPSKIEWEKYRKVESKGRILKMIFPKF